jgi:hypothetical protein
MNRNTQKARIGESYNISHNAIEDNENSPPQILARQPSLRPLLGPSSGPSLVMPQLASNQPYLQGLGQPLQYGQPLQLGSAAFEDQQAERERRAMLAVQANMNRIIRPAMDAVEQQRRDRQAHMKASVAEWERQQAIEAEEARRFQEERRAHMRRSVEAAQQQQAIQAERSRQTQAEIANIRRLADQYAADMRKRR